MKTLERLAWNRPEWWTLLVGVAAWVALLIQALGRHHSGGFGASLAHWLLMIAAMMLPLQLVVVRSVAFQSLRRRRHLAIATFLVGYLAPWLVAGIPALAITHLVQGRLVAAAAFGLAAILMLTDAHRWALDACHASRSLAPVGLAATRDALKYGAFIGGVCVMACWPLMVACTLADHALVALLGGAVVGLLERLAFRPRVRAAALVVGLLAIYEVAR